MTIDHASDGAPDAGGASSHADLHRRIRELEESERLFRGFVEETDDIITRTDADGALLYLNPAAARSLELTAAACAGRRLFDFLHPEDRKRVEAELSDGIAHQSTSVTLESRFVGGSGQILELLWRFNLRYDEGRLTAINAIARDIRDRKRIEQSLREREAGLAEAQRIAHLGNWNLDIPTDSLSWTDEIYRIFGLTPQEFKANRGAFFERVHPDDAAYVVRENEAALANERPYSVEHRIIRPNGEVRHVFQKAEVTFDESGAPVRFFGTVQDITEQVEADAARREREMRLRMFESLVEHAMDGITVTDLTGRTEYVNPAFLRECGVSDPEAARQRDLVTFYADEEARRFQGEIMAEVLSSGHWQGRLWAARADGSRYLAHTSMVVLTDPTEKPVAVASFTRNITAEYEVERQREALQEQMIEAHQATIRALATPLIPLAEGLIAMPLVGTIDGARAQQIVETLLRGISDQRARTAIMDITGVKLVDAAVADGLLRAARAARLLGAEVILTGVSPEVARVLVELSIDMGGLVTCSTIERGIAHARRPR
jgi:rsbT co-antagonist protein RsbR